MTSSLIFRTLLLLNLLLLSLMSTDGSLDGEELSEDMDKHMDYIQESSVHEQRGYNKREHSLIKPYQGSGMDIPNWDIVGSTVVTPQYIRLTPDDKSRQGGIWNKVPVRSRDWEMVVTFKVHGNAGELFGDGFAIWYAQERAQLGNVFGSKDQFKGLAIFVDTYSNHNGAHKHSHPYVSAMIGNGIDAYDHDSDGTHTQLGGHDSGCESKFRNKDYDTSYLIRYVEDKVELYQDIYGGAMWSKCFSVPGVRLPTGYFLGFTAATGDLSDNHDILSVRFYELDIVRVEKEGDTDRANIVPEAEFKAAPRDHVTNPAPSRLSGIKTFFLVILGIGIVGVVLVGGVLFMQKRQEQARKRFY